MKKIFCSSVILCLLTGCSILGQPAAGKIADGVDIYCSEDFDARVLYRKKVNEALAGEGHTIRIDCAGDLDRELF